MSNGPTVLLLAPTPAFFERRDTWFNRRGVDVFCALDLHDAASIFAMRRVDVVLAQGPPDGMDCTSARRVIPPEVPIIVLSSKGCPTALLDTYRRSAEATVVAEPYDDKIMHATARILEVPDRHYLRILVQVQGATGQAGTFGFSNNISTTGILMETRRELQIGETLQLSFLLPGAGQMTAVSALVVRQAHSGEGGTMRFGMKFIDLTESDLETITAMLSQADARKRAANAR